MKSLRIFYAADHTPNPFMPASRLWYNNLYLPLVDLGHDVVPFDYDLTAHFRNLDPSDPPQKAFIEENRPKLEQALLAQVTKAHQEKPIDLFFSYFYSACTRPDVIRTIGQMGIVTVNWYCNASYQFHLVEEIAPAYDYCLVPEKYRLQDYRRVGANPIYCQEAANPNIYKPYTLAQDFDVTFVGQKYGERAAYIGYLLDQGIDVRVWGMRWTPPVPNSPHASQPQRNLAQRLTRLATRQGRRDLIQRIGRVLGSYDCRHPAPLPASIQIVGDDIPVHRCGPPLADDELIRMYSRSRISLGFSTVGDTHLDEQPLKQIRLRDFEAPMSGAFYMVEYMEDIEEFFIPGKEIVCYHDKVDLADKVKYYLAHDSEREAIRWAGYQRAISEHTWHKRFLAAFQSMGLLP